MSEEGTPTLMQKLRELLPANRVAALTGVVLAIIAFLVTISSSLVPGSPAAEAIGKGIVLLGTLVTVLRIIEKFMDGSQNYDSLLLAGQPKTSGALVSASATVADDEEAPVEDLVEDAPPVPSRMELEAAYEGEPPVPPTSVAGKPGMTA